MATTSRPLRWTGSLACDCRGTFPRSSLPAARRFSVLRSASVFARLAAGVPRLAVGIMLPPQWLAGASDGWVKFVAHYPISMTRSHVQPPPMGLVGGRDWAMPERLSGSAKLAHAVLELASRDCGLRLRIRAFGLRRRR